jgi:peptide/nickel transport system ATP-binding protein
MGVVADIADRVLVMRRGSEQEQGSVSDILLRPQSAYARELLCAVPRLGSMRGAAQPRKAAEITCAAPPPQPATQDEAPILEIEGLTTRFAIDQSMFRGAKRFVYAVEDVSFALKRGETLALVGESGCGKSTTGRSIVRLVEPTSGAVRFDGEDVLAAGGTGLRKIRRSVQMIFQDPYASLNPRKLIGSAIAEPMLVHEVESRDTVGARVAELLRQVDLDPATAERFPHEFSGGQRQRICIARALGLAPKLIIADEAVSALDVSIKAQVIDLMIELQRQLGVSYLFISHDIAVVERISHRVAVMYLGEIVEIGPRDAVINTPHHPYTKRLMAAVRLPDPTMRHGPATLMSSEVPSAVHDAGYVGPKTELAKVGTEHFIRVLA